MSLVDSGTFARPSARSTAFTRSPPLCQGIAQFHQNPGSFGKDCGPSKPQRVVQGKAHVVGKRLDAYGARH
jgi:hypothetical protein